MMKSETPAITKPTDEPQPQPETPTAAEEGGIAKRKPGRPRKTMSEAQLAANQANAGKSTGAKTPRGKAFSKRNPLKHGLFMSADTMLAEERAQLQTLRDKLREGMAPQGTLEECLVEKLADSLWRLDRSLRCETASSSVQLAARVPTGNPSIDQLEATKAQFSLLHGEDLERILRYETTFQRHLISYLKMLNEMQKARKDRE